jgi:uncharacterized protein involved in type VI secretion and phage assembly
MPPTVDRVLNPVVKIGGAPLNRTGAKKLRSLRVELSLWVPGRCSMRFTDDDFALTDSTMFEVGKAVDIEVPSAQGSTTEVFSGEITDLTLEPAAGGFELVVGALDKSHRLASKSTPRTFANQTLSAIVSTVAQGSGLTPSVESTSGSIPYVLQTGSDFDMLAELALRCGYEWWVAGTTLNVKKRGTTSGATLTYGQGLYDFRVRYSAIAKGKQVTVRGWGPDNQQDVKATAVMNGTSMPGIGADSTLVTGSRGKATWAKELETAAYGVTTADEATSVAATLAKRADASEVTARGTSIANPTVKPGTKVTIKGVGTKASGGYFVTSVEHVYNPDRPGPNMITRFTAGNQAPVALADMLGAADRGRQFDGVGLVIGTVTNIKDDPDKYGRVKCKFPALSTTLESAWCRVASPGSGAERGFQFTPELDDEVVVGFEHGDLRYPVILGGVWSKTKKPPQVPVDSPMKTRQIKSKDHILEFCDDTDATKAGVSVTLKDEKSKLRLGLETFEVEIPADKEIVFKSGDNMFQIAASNGNVTIKTKGKIVIDAAQDLELKGANVKIEAKAGFEVKANTQAKINAQAGLNLETAAVAVLKGSLVNIN